MKKVIVILFVLISLKTWATTPPMNEVRLLYQKAAVEKSSCIRLLNLLNNCNQDNAVLIGYKACASMIMAKHTLNPFKKILFFRTGKQMLENIIANNDNNIELRYLRLTIQTNIPSFLRYKNEIKGDKQYIIECIPNIKDEQLKSLITSYIKQLATNK